MSVNTVQNQQISQIKKPDNSVRNGALIGAGVGLVPGALFSAGVINMCKPEAKDVFLKNMQANFDKNGMREAGVEHIKKYGEELYKKHLDACSNAIKECKKAIPKNLAITAGIGLAIGVGIGFLVKKIKENKAEKTNS